MKIGEGSRTHRFSSRRSRAYPALRLCGGRGRNRECINFAYRITSLDVDHLKRLEITKYRYQTVNLQCEMVLVLPMAPASEHALEEGCGKRNVYKLEGQTKSMNRIRITDEQSPEQIGKEAAERIAGDILKIRGASRSLEDEDPEAYRACMSSLRELQYRSEVDRHSFEKGIGVLYEILRSCDN